MRCPRRGEGTGRLALTLAVAVTGCAALGDYDFGGYQGVPAGSDAAEAGMGRDGTDSERDGTDLSETAQVDASMTDDARDRSMTPDSSMTPDRPTADDADRDTSFASDAADTDSTSLVDAI